MEIKQEIKYGILCGIMLISIFFQTSCSNNNDTALNIEISTSGCYRSCPVIDIKVLNDKVYFNLIKFNDKEGSFEYKINKEEKEELKSLLAVIQLESLEDEYTSNRVDMQAYSVYINKSGAEKEIYYYESESPESLERLVRKIINFKNKELVKTSYDFKSKTRGKVPLLEIPIPPMPNLQK